MMTTEEVDRQTAQSGEYDNLFRSMPLRDDWPQAFKDRWYEVNQSTNQSQTGNYDYGSLSNKYYGNIGSALSGQVPQDVQNLIATKAAEYGIATGMPGSQIAAYSGLRNLGLTSLDQQRWGASQLQQQELQRKQAALQQDAQQQQAYLNYVYSRIQDQDRLRAQAAADWNKAKATYTPPVASWPSGGSTAVGGSSSPLSGYRNMNLGRYNPTGSSYVTGLGTVDGTGSSNMAIINEMLGERPISDDISLAPLSGGSDVSSYSTDWTIPQQAYSEDFGEGIYG